MGRRTASPGGSGGVKGLVAKLRRSVVSGLRRRLPSLLSGLTDGGLSREMMVASSSASTEAGSAIGGMRRSDGGAERRKRHEACGGGRRRRRKFVFSIQRRGGFVHISIIESDKNLEERFFWIIFDLRRRVVC